MAGYDKNSQDTDMDMNPMIDCVFLLMIFFVLVIDLSQKDLEDLILPKAEEAVPDENPPENRPVINIAQDGLMVYKGKIVYDPLQPEVYGTSRQPQGIVNLLVEWKNTEGFLKEVKEQNLGVGLVKVVEDPILIRADKWTKWGYVGDFMLACSQPSTAYRKLELAMSEEDKESKVPGIK